MTDAELLRAVTRPGADRLMALRARLQKLQDTTDTELKEQGLEWCPGFAVADAQLSVRVAEAQARHRSALLDFDERYGVLAEQLVAVITRDGKVIARDLAQYVKRDLDLIRAVLGRLRVAGRVMSRGSWWVPG